MTGKSVFLGRPLGRRVAIGGVMSLLLVGCGFLLKPVPTGQSATVRIVVDSPFDARGIYAEDVDVTSLDLTVSGGTFSYGVTWVPADGKTQYDVSLPSAGTYDVEAVHHGVKGDGSPISATESVTVLVQPLVISVVTIIPGQILAVIVADLPLGRFDEHRWDQALFAP